MRNETLQQAIGRRLRELRHDLGLRQDTVAQGARDVGLLWRQATVAAIEHGQRAVALEEFVLLPLALWHASERATGIGYWVALADLLPDDDWVELTERTSAHTGALRDLLTGRRPDSQQPFDGEIDTPSSERIADPARAMQARGRLARLWPGASWRELDRALAAAAGEAERKAARKLGVPPQVVSVAAYARWGRSLTEERDRRVAAQTVAPQTTGGIKPRTLQALRGHVTRALLDELARSIPRR